MTKDDSERSWKLYSANIMCFEKSLELVKPFVPSAPFPYPLQHQNTARFSNVFRV